MRLLGSTVALAAASLVLAGCSTSTDSAPAPSPRPPTVLTSAQLRTALLRPSDIGAGFHAGKHADGPNGTRCLSRLQVADSQPRRAELTVYGGTQFGLPTILEGIVSLDSAQSAEQLLAHYRKVIAACPSDDDHDTSEARIRMHFRFGKDVPLLPVDDQVVMSGTGTVGDAPSLTADMAYVVARLGNHVILTGFGDVRGLNESRSAVAQVAIYAVSRLRALLAAKPQPTLTPIDLKVTEVQDVIG